MSKEHSMRRVDRCNAALDAIKRARLYDEETAEPDADSIFLTDILADILHYCAANDIDFAARLQMAEMHYDAEKDGSEE